MRKSYGETWKEFKKNFKCRPETTAIWRVSKKKKKSELIEKLIKRAK